MYQTTPHPNERDAITNLQRYLRQLHFSEPEIPQPPIDGIFESATEESLRAFQRSRGLPPTGRADQITWELLFEAYRAALVSALFPSSVDLFPVHPRGYALTVGDRGLAVNALQYALQELQHTYGTEFPTPITGIYTEETRDAVVAFQRWNGLPGTGITDLLTWNRIMDQYNSLFQGYRAE